MTMKGINLHCSRCVMIISKRGRSFRHCCVCGGNDGEFAECLVAVLLDGMTAVEKEDDRMFEKYGSPATSWQLRVWMAKASLLLMQRCDHKLFPDDNLEFCQKCITE